MKICLIGTGNVAWHLGKAFAAAGMEVVQVVGRNQTTAKELGEVLGTVAADFDQIDPNAALYILAIKDDAIPIVAKQFFGKLNPNAIVVHTSGSTSLAVLERYFDQVGCIYPLQTFSKQKQVNLQSVPIFVTANLMEIEAKLVELAKGISDKVLVVNDNQRLSLHVAAVFACNFSNHMLAIASELLHQQYLDFNLLQPLVEETIQKAFELSPIEGQTGPALREDMVTLEKHLKYLQNNVQYQKVYQTVSDSIMDLGRKKQ